MPHPLQEVVIAFRPIGSTGAGSRSSEGSQGAYEHPSWQLATVGATSPAVAAACCTVPPEWREVCGPLPFLWPSSQCSCLSMLERASAKVVCQFRPPLALSMQRWRPARAAEAQCLPRVAQRTPASPALRGCSPTAASTGPARWPGWTQTLANQSSLFQVTHCIGLQPFSHSVLCPLAHQLSQQHFMWNAACPIGLRL